MDTQHPAFDTSVAHQARIYDYLLGGKDNFAADRKAGDALIEAYPTMVDLARANRNASGFKAKWLRAGPFVVALCDCSWLRACCSGFPRNE